MFFKLLVLLLLQFGFDALVDAQQKPAVEKESRDYRSSGYHGLNCSRYFVIYNNGQKFLMQCPSNLYFDLATLQCIDKHKVHECRELTWQAAPPASKNFNNIYPTVFSCEGKLDGVYQQHCAKLFVLCKNGIATFLRCPKGLIYDGKLARCAKAVSGCGKILPGRIRPEHNLLKAFSCAKTAYGLFTPVGEGFTVKCTKGKSILFHCPGNMVLVPVTMSCVLKPSKEIYSKKRSKRHVVYDLEDSDGLDRQYDVLTRIITKLKSPHVFDRVCAGLPFGVHGVECSTKFVVALPDYCAIADCPPGYIFTNARHYCVARAEVPGCNKVVNTIAIDANLLEMEPVEDHSAVLVDPVHVMAVATTAPLIPIRHRFDCLNKLDYYYGWSCSSHYIKCVRDNPIHQMCPGKLKFDIETRRCLEMKYVRGCSTENGNEHLVVKVTHGPLEEVPLKMQPARMCHGRDVVISVDCGRFTVCIDNVEYEFQCPANHYYDLKSGICVLQTPDRRC